MRHLLIIFFSLQLCHGFSQNGGVKPPPPPPSPMIPEVPPPPMAVEEYQDETLNMSSVQQKPVFPGGDAALFKYLASNVKYPAIAAENGIQGKVILSFIVNKTGKIEEVTLLRGIGGGCDQEAIRVVNNMPNWVPGKHNGLPVKVQYTLPISFKLEQEETIYTEDQVDTKASFIPGENAMSLHLTRTLSYPPSAKENGIQGKVIVRFVVDASGKASNFTIYKSVSVDCDANALLSVKSLPNTWIPASKNGKPVSSYVEIPCSYNLRG